MRKTNIRVNNNFIIKDKKKYFLSKKLAFLGKKSNFLQD